MVIDLFYAGCLFDADNNLWTSDFEWIETCFFIIFASKSLQENWLPINLSFGLTLSDLLFYIQVEIFGHEIAQKPIGQKAH